MRVRGEERAVGRAKLMVEEVCRNTLQVPGWLSKKARRQVEQETGATLGLGSRRPQAGLGQPLLLVAGSREQVQAGRTVLENLMALRDSWETTVNSQKKPSGMVKRIRKATGATIWVVDKAQGKGPPGPPGGLGWTVTVWGTREQVRGARRALQALQGLGERQGQE